MENITAIILTYNEEAHLARCLESVRSLANRIVVVDCYSSDLTLEIARRYGAEILQRNWVNHSVQFNWALEQLSGYEGWVLRIDADEIMSCKLSEEISACLSTVDDRVNGIFFYRRMTFLGRPIHHGGVFPVQVMRFFRYGHGACENRWMDEHIKVTGSTCVVKGEILDDNLNTLTWWTDKHNKYSNREAVELLNLEYGFMVSDSIAGDGKSRDAGVKRWVKERIYARLPMSCRALFYFSYRYFVRLGFLDGKEGFAFHFLQAFWYRFLVDEKIREVKRYMSTHDVDIKTAIYRALSIKV